MLVLVTYDVSTETPAGRRRLRRVARACLDFGQRVQKSVFECEVDPAQWTALRARLIGEIDAEHDSLRFSAPRGGAASSMSARGPGSTSRGRLSSERPPRVPRAGIACVAGSRA